MANPNKTTDIANILAANKDKLVKYLASFHADKGEKRFTENTSFVGRKDLQLSNLYGSLGSMDFG